MADGSMRRLAGPAEFRQRHAVAALHSVPARYCRQRACMGQAGARLRLMGGRLRHGVCV